ncbi:MAG TPA: hypothetical protein DCQ31_15315 [Bacteroidales bacterium]|nr:hypothetical protein [Bacteroidales bacterium]
MEQSKKALLLGLSAILFWSTAAVAFKISLAGMGFADLLFYSSGTAAVILFAYIWYLGKLTELASYSAKQYFQSALVSLLNPFGYYLVLLYAYSILPAQIAQPLNYTWPIMLVLLSVPLLGQKIDARSVVAIFISFSGVLVISSQGNLLNYQIDNPTGVLMATGSSVLWALFWIFNLKDKRDEVIKLFLNFAFGFVYTGIIIFFFFEFKFPPVKNFMASVYVGFFEMGITFVLWLKALALSTSNVKISNLVFISPFMSLLFIALILKEEIHATTLIGLALIISGIVVQQKKKKV